MIRNEKIIIGLAVLALIVFGGYKLLNNISSGDAITKSVQFDYENVQQYDGTKAYVEVNGNKPYFTEKELTKKHMLSTRLWILLKEFHQLWDV